MVPWVELATAPAPQGDRLRLLRRGDEFSIRIAAGNELMNSRLGGSEAALAELAIARIGGNRAGGGAGRGVGGGAGMRILIGGLGMGFTLRAAQALVPPDARIVVSEIVPELVEWARGPMGAVFDRCLDDPRVEIRIGDVGHEIRATAAAYDAILLDVDNGPDGLTRADNEALYGREGLAAAGRALRPGGVLGVWSAGPDPVFARRLSRCGFTVHERTVRAGRTRRGVRHTIWLGQRPSA